MSIKCRNPELLSNLSSEMTEPKTGVTGGGFREKYSLRLGFCPMSISKKSASTAYISSAVRSCHSFTLDRLEKILPVELLKCFAYRLVSVTIFCTTSLTKKLFKYIYSVSQTISIVLRSANYTKFLVFRRNCPRLLTEN
jgi:hypothetical protein